VRTIIDTAVEGSKPFVESRKHSLTVGIPDEPIFIFGDLTRLAQVVSNLINNSCKYTPEGGHIQVRISRLPNLVSIQVQDDGLGIPPEMLDKIFEMFGQVNRTLDRAQGGLGIGLALVRKLVELHGGTVQAESPGINRGATFTITLPQDPEAEVPVPKPLDEPATPIQSRRILVIDDNVDAAESLSMFLQLSGHTTKVAYSPSVGLKLAQEFKPDMVFLDIGLPEMTGYEVARRIRSSPIGKSTCLIAVTGWGAEKDRDAAKEAGFNAHITKPVDLDEISRLLEHGTADHAFDV
jgi:CheY-like chemotaxis protein/anti-sigma regulatory factor (Ser/Thr protein kinase)